MRIFFERTGGFAGRKLTGSLDSSALPALQARRLNKLLEQSHFFDLPVKMESTSPGADRFLYRLTVETENITHTVEACEAALPAEMRPLRDFLAGSLFVK